jgi:hypothetical protein
MGSAPQAVTDNPPRIISSDFRPVTLDSSSDPPDRSVSLAYPVRPVHRALSLWKTRGPLGRVRCAHYGAGTGFSGSALPAGLIRCGNPWFDRPDAGFHRYLWRYGVYREPAHEGNRHTHGLGRRSQSNVMDEFAGRSSAHSHCRWRRIGDGLRTLGDHACNAVPRRRERSRDLCPRSSRAQRSWAARDLLSQSQGYTSGPQCGLYDSSRCPVLTCGAGAPHSRGGV